MFRTLVSSNNLPLMMMQLQLHKYNCEAYNNRTSATEATVDLKQTFKLHKLDSGPPTSVQITREDAISYFTQMYTIRRMEASAAKLYRKKIVRGLCHLHTGHEACAVGMRAAMRDEDNVITSYRCHGWAYLMGVTPKAILTELTGRQSGCSRGKGGSMHMYGQSFYGGNGIVGAQVPLGAGIALACKYKGNKGVCLTIYGEGASNQGQVFEAFNMSYLFQLPCVFVCENNNYSMSSSADRIASNTDFFRRGDALPGIWVDGTDVLAVRAVTQFAMDYVVKNGALVMEAETYRYHGHSMSYEGQDETTKKEMKSVRKSSRDGIVSFVDLCVQRKLLTEEEIADIKKTVRAEIEEATKLAVNDKELDLKHLYADVYAKNLEPKIRGIHGFHHNHIQDRKGINDN